jgi:COP9 signalosome complex subunit 1
VKIFQVILCFYESKYGKCLTLLEEMKDNLLLDVYLAGHVHNLYSLIRNRSLIQYFR